MLRKVQYGLVRGALILACAALMLLTSRTAAFAQSGITSPAPGATLAGDVPIMGTATTDAQGLAVNPASNVIGAVSIEPFAAASMIGAAASASTILA